MFYNKNIINERAFDFSHLLNKPKTEQSSIDFTDWDNLLKHIIRVADNTLFAEADLMDDYNKRSLRSSTGYKSDMVFPRFKPEGNSLYMYPINTLDYGPIKIKKVPTAYFYLYKVTVNPDSKTIHFGVNTCNSYSTIFFVNFLKPIIDFIDLCNIPVDDFYYYRNTGDYHAAIPSIDEIDGVKRGCIFLSGIMHGIIKNDNFKKMQIPKEWSIPDGFADNFPANIPKLLDSSAKPVRLYKGMFSNNNRYLKVVKSLTNAGYTVLDEDLYVYTADNIDNFINGNTSNETKYGEETESTVWLKNINIDLLNFREVLERNINRKHVYLSNLRKMAGKDTLTLNHYTIIELFKANNINPVKYWKDTIKQIQNKNYSSPQITFAAHLLADALSQWSDDEILMEAAKICTYRLCQKIIKDLPNKFEIKEDPDTKEFYHGYISSFTDNYGREHSSYTLTPLTIMDMPIGIDNPDILMYLMKAINYSVINVLDFFDDVMNNVEGLIDDYNAGIELLYKRADAINPVLNDDSFNYDPLVKTFNNLVKTIVNN